MANELLQQIIEKLDHVDAKVTMLCRARQDSKHIKLLETLKRRGRITAPQVDDLFNISRTASLNLMQKTAKLPGVKYMPGQKYPPKAGYLLFNSSEITKAQFKVIMAELNKHTTVRLHLLIDLLNLPIEDVQTISKDFVNTYSDFELNRFEIRRKSNNPQANFIEKSNQEGGHNQRGGEEE